jgi:hypothetical protein
VLGTFSHNPTVVYSPADKLYLLYYIGCSFPQPTACVTVQFSCGRGNDLNGESGISVLTSPNLREWTPLGEIFSGDNNDMWDATGTNPSPFVLESPSPDIPSILLAYRGCPYNCNNPYGPELISLAFAPHYTGPYTRAQTAPVFAAPNEDPFLWRDKRGHFHMLLHSLQPGGGFGDGPKVGCHAYAKTWDGTWTFNDRTLAYNTTVHFTDGTTVDYHRMERPQIFFSEDGEMTPLYMTNGVQEKNSKASYTLVLRLGSGPRLYEKQLGFGQVDKDEL